MPIINILTWPTKAEVKQRIMTEITRVIHVESGAPLDKITVIFQEIERNSWSEAGILGEDPKFPIESRRQRYE